MKSSKKIVVPFDFSQESLNALIFAKALAEKLNLEIKIFHSLAYQKFPYNQSEQDLKYQKSLLINAKNEIEQLVEKIIGNSSKIQIEVNNMNVSEGIIKYSHDSDVLYTLLGKKQKTIPSKVSSITRDIIRYAKGAVISITEKFHLESIKNILFITDFTDTPIDTIHSIKLIQKVTNAKVTLLYVNTKEDWLSTEETIKRKIKFCNIHKLENTDLQIINDQNLENGVFNVAKKGHFNFIGIRIKLLEEKLDLTNTHLSVERIMDNIDIPILSYTHRRPML